MTAKLIVQLHVTDYDRFKSVFDEMRPVRKEHAATAHRLHRGVDDPNRVVVVTEFATADDARAFTRSAALKEAQQRAGMDAPPDFLVCEEVETDTY
ncbi:antibiotic biosynthesis monooxygenase family protein [Phytohabitans sp. LJ34]|uniref:antibiotic biosynthesis monooxygenase family protein n=1 Tax=Phytohabitans sp. LJ34 TaxID=3452217 RepID=UPI003F8C1974